MRKSLVTSILITLLVMTSCTQAPELPEEKDFQPTSTGAPEGELLKIVGQIGGSTQAVAVRGNYAYVGVGLRLIILEISDSAAPPREVGSTVLFSGSIEDVLISGSHAYIATGEAGLHIVDVSDPTYPVKVGSYDTSGYTEGLALNGQYVYVADGPNGLRVLDVSVPGNPMEVGCACSLDYAFGVAVVGRYAHVAAGGAGLAVVDISNPEAPIEIGSYDTPGYAYGIAAAGDIAYIADGWEGLRLIDVTSPNQPVEITRYDSPGWAMGVEVEGSTLYLADAFAGLRVLDISSITRPVEIGAFEIPDGHAEDLAVSDGTVYVADRNLGLHVIDMSIPTECELIASYSPIGFADGVALSGEYAYVAAGQFGLRIVDISSPENPREVGAFQTEHPAQTVSATGNFTFVSTFSPIMYVVDTTELSHLKAASLDLRTLPISGRAVGTMVRNQLICNDILYLPSEGGFFLMDISDPLSPYEVGFMNFYSGGLPTTKEPSATGVAVSNGIAYVAAEVGLLIIDVSDPNRPKLLGIFNEPLMLEKGKLSEMGIRDVIVSGSYVYVLDLNLLRVLDISDPVHPEEKGFCELPIVIMGSGPFLAATDNNVYVADGAAGLVSVDVSDPNKPMLETRHRLPGYASAVALDGKYIYVAAQEGGLFILQHTVDDSTLSKPQSETKTFMSLSSSGEEPVNSRQYLRGVAVLGGRNDSPSPEMLRLEKILVLSGVQTQQAFDSTGNVLMVTNSADSGAGTLRSCLQSAQIGDTITFDPKVFSPENPITITLASGLPILNQGNLTIDASNAGVIIDGSGTPKDTMGLSVYSDNNVIKGLQIVNFPGAGLIISGANNVIGGNQYQGDGNVISGSGFCDVYFKLASGNTIIGNYIGTDATGRVKLSNTAYFWIISIEGSSANNRIEGNVITGGVRIGDIGSSYNEVIGNFIGVDATGITPFDGWAGVFVEQPFNRIGGAADSERNIINGNISIAHGGSHTVVINNFVSTSSTGRTSFGRGFISIEGDHNFIGGTTEEERNLISGEIALAAGADSNFVVGNYLGADITGSVALSSASISLSGAAYNVIQGNVISGGDWRSAISLSQGADFNWVRNNNIGTDLSGTVALSEKGAGLEVADGEHNIIEANLISGNKGGGVILGEGANFNRLQANYIGTTSDGITPLPNNQAGGIIIHGISNLVGGSTPEDGNVIGFNSKTGIFVAESGRDNCFCNNSFLENLVNAIDEGNNNIWDHDGRGNYWSDYRGRDANGDGIGDTPYEISRAARAMDRYPLIEPYSQ